MKRARSITNGLPRCCQVHEAWAQYQRGIWYGIECGPARNPHLCARSRFLWLARLRWRLAVARSGRTR